MDKIKFQESREFKRFACEMLKLDKDRSSKVPRDFYSTHSFEQISHFHGSLVSDIEDIFQSAHASQASRIDLSSSIFRFCEKTTAGYVGVSDILRETFGTSFSKGYICRLYHAGRLRHCFKALRDVKDLEKLYLISKLKLDDGVIADNISGSGTDVCFSGLEVNRTPRKDFKNHLKRKFLNQESHLPRVDHSDSAENEQAKTPSERCSLETLRDSLKQHLDLFSEDKVLEEQVKLVLMFIEEKMSELQEGDNSDTKI